MLFMSTNERAAANSKLEDSILQLREGRAEAEVALETLKREGRIFM